jgi:hypothetical protein
MKEAQEMAENKAERRTKAEWAKEQADQRSARATRRRRTRCTSACGARRRSQRTTRKVEATNGAPYYRMLPRLSAAHTRLEDT